MGVRRNLACDKAVDGAELNVGALRNALMYSLERKLAEIPLLVTGFLRSLYRIRPLQVFLCGSEPEDMRFDVRSQVRYLLNTYMGCQSFFGEEISDSSSDVKAKPDLLTIEVRAAWKSDLIIMFLGSTGTIAELTAFAMTKQVRHKLLVFNSRQFKEKRTFVNLGPLSLLRSEQVAYYESGSAILSTDIIKQLDRRVAETWFEKYHRFILRPQGDSEQPCLSFEAFMTLAVIAASFPVRYQDLVHLVPLQEHELPSALKVLFNLKLVAQKEKKYILAQSAANLPIQGECVAEIARVRCCMLGLRLKDDDAISDYRLIM